MKFPIKTRALGVLLLLLLSSCDNEKYTPKNPINYYLINLDQSPELLTKMSHRFKAAGLGFKRIRGILGKALNRAHLAEEGLYAEPPKREAYLVDGELGCYLSHEKALQTAYTDKVSYAVVLEDDAEFTHKLPYQVDQIIQHAPSDWDMIYLYCGAEWKEAHNPCHPNRLPKTPDGRFTRLNEKCVAGTVGYLVHTNSIQRILPHLLPAIMPIDFMFREMIKGKFGQPLVAYCANPQVLSTGNDPSKIGKRNTKDWEHYLE